MPLALQQPPLVMSRRNALGDDRITHYDNRIAICDKRSWLCDSRNANCDVASWNCGQSGSCRRSIGDENARADGFEHFGCRKISLFLDGRRLGIR